MNANVCCVCVCVVNVTAGAVDLNGLSTVHSAMRNREHQYGVPHALLVLTAPRGVPASLQAVASRFGLGHPSTSLWGKLLC